MKTHKKRSVWSFALLPARRELFPAVALILSSLGATLVVGCGPIDIRDVATPHEAFLGRWMLDSDSRLVVDHSSMIEGGIDDDGLACADLFEYEVLDQTHEPFELTVKMRRMYIQREGKFLYSEYEHQVTFEFSKDRRQMRAMGVDSWSTHVDGGAIDPEFENLEMQLPQADRWDVGQPD